MKTTFSKFLLMNVFQHFLPHAIYSHPNYSAVVKQKIKRKHVQHIYNSTLFYLLPLIFKPQIIHVQCEQISFLTPVYRVPWPKTAISLFPHLYFVIVAFLIKFVY